MSVSCITRTFAVATACLLAAMGPTRAAGTGTITVFAAASMTNALQSVGTLYEKTTGTHVTFSFASSGMLAKQIDASGGADIFVSADTGWMDFLQQHGRIEPATRSDLLGNRLVLIAPESSPVTLTIAPHFPLATALGGGRLAVADTSTVPAGRYARAALSSLGVWDRVSTHLAPAENVRVALAYVARGEAPLGIVYRTDALIEPAVKVVGTFPEGSHPAIVYPAAVVKGARPGAAAFLAYLSTAPARAVFETAGFSVLPAAPAH